MSKELVLVISKMIKEWCECTSSACPRQKSTFVNVATLFILSGTFFKLLKDYKARYMGIGKVDKDMALFYEDKKEKEKEEK